MRQLQAQDILRFLPSTFSATLSHPLVLGVAAHQSWEQAGQEANAEFHLAELHLAERSNIRILPPCPLGKSHPSEGSAGPGSTEFFLQTLDKLVIQEEQLTMRQEAEEDGFNAISSQQEVGAGG